MTWHPWLHLNRRLRAVIGARLEHDRRLAALMREHDELARAGWFN